jgi:ubiquitin-protein ligase E3 C
LVDVAFAEFFLAKWIGRQSFLDDLPSLDPELYQGLMFLKNYKGDVEKDLSLNFTVSEQGFFINFKTFIEFGESKTVELIPNGSNIPVTSDNRIQYIYLCSNYKVNTQMQKQCHAFFSGLKDLIDPVWLKMFNQKELSLILGGVSVPINVKELQTHVQYSGGFDVDHPTIILFWEIVQEFSQEYLQKLIKFITSCPRPPLLGFGELRPAICIRRAGDCIDRLPTASTCINLLKLPEYTDAVKFKEYFYKF